MKKEKIIMENSDEAATYRTNISGWVDRHGQFFGHNEELARCSGATHKLCECGKATPRVYVMCNECRDKLTIVNHNIKETKKWDKNSFIYSQKYDKYFDGIEELENFLNEYGKKDRPEIADLLLVHCDPQYLNQINEDYWSDLLPDECELPDEVIEALDDLNDVIREHEPVSWVPGIIAVEDFEVEL